MTFLNMLYTLLIKPLQILFEFVYSIAYRLLDNPGLSIIALSIAINLLVLPLYRRADAMQEEERLIEEKLRDGVAHIKKTFRGDEKTMMLQTYYRQNNYSPTRVFRGSVSLLLQIPFFIAAYQFLSNLELLQGVSFGPIADLGQPDALLTIAGFSINLLPIIMTVINVVSTIIFTKGQPLKSKIQLYALAAFFLVFLYNSPSGLVFYWTLNNLFSLVKTIFYKLKNSKLILKWIAFAVGGVSILYGIYAFITAHGSKLRLVFFVGIGIILCFPLLYSWATHKKMIKHSSFKFIDKIKPDWKRFIFCGIFLSVLIGLLIPSAVIKASPQEFVNITYFVHPIWYLVSAFLLAIGTFLIWMGVFYWLFSKKAKVIFEALLWAFCGIAAFNYFLFGRNLGILDANLKYEDGLFFTTADKCFNLIAICIVAAIMLLIFFKWHRKFKKIVPVVIVAICCMVAINSVSIVQSVSKIDLSSSQTENSPHFTLSKTEKNVIVIMLDRAMGEYIPYIFNEKPELQEKFSGFTYYSDTVSFGPFTNFASPALYGGYEYTPIEINTRSSESLESKQNEALKVMPVIFDQAGYDVTVINPTYAGYNWIPDLSIYDDYPDIQTYNTSGYFTSESTKAELVEKRFRNFFTYSFMKCMPVLTQSVMYNGGEYNDCSKTYSGQTQTIINQSKATGLSSVFLDPYYALCNLDTMTNTVENENGCFLMFSNDMTHDPCLLQEPEYEPALKVDNTEFDQNNQSRFTVNGKTLVMEKDAQYTHYESNMATMIQLGKWFDHLKDQGVYDNTRIILVSDHGNGLGQVEDLIINEDDNSLDLEFFYPLLMVKDFNSTGFNVSTQFMTNADVPTLATDNLIANATNPFTGKTISSSTNKNDDLYVIFSGDWDTTVNSGNQFLPARWYSVHNSIWNKNNWSLVAEDAILTK